MNFNDYGCALITLFSQMIINNWFVTVDMYVDIEKDSWVWVRCFFISFWIAIVLIQVNIVIAIILEINSSVTQLVHDRYRRWDIKDKLREHFKDASEDEIRRQIAEARAIINAQERRLSMQSKKSKG